RFQNTYAFWALMRASNTSLETHLKLSPINSKLLKDGSSAGSTMKYPTRSQRLLCMQGQFAMKAPFKSYQNLMKNGVSALERDRRATPTFRLHAPALRSSWGD